MNQCFVCLVGLQMLLVIMFRMKHKAVCIVSYMELWHSRMCFFRNKVEIIDLWHPCLSHLRAQCLSQGMHLTSST
jgi:hypothetical protein